MNRDTMLMSTGDQDSTREPQQLAFSFYRVKLEVFEGPLDLLLHLIKKNEVEIADIPIAMITEQYLAYLELMRDLNLDVAGEFLVMAATLMLVKSRQLLPPSEEIEEEEPDPRAELMQQLVEYQKYREAALALSERPFLRRDVFVREPQERDADETGASQEPVRLRVSVWDLMEAFRAVLQRAQPQAVHEVVVERISLRERAELLLQALSRVGSLAFESLFADDTTRIEVLATFLALLELMKMGAVRATQEERYGTIQIELAVADIATVAFGVLDEYERSTAPPPALATEGGREGDEDGGDSGTR
jgi:segregation and condensation protein A